MLTPYADGGHDGKSVLSLDPALSAARKRECVPSSEPLDVPMSTGNFTDSLPDSYWHVASSPPTEAWAESTMGGDTPTDDDIDLDDLDAGTFRGKLHSEPHGQNLAQTGCGGTQSEHHSGPVRAYSSIGRNSSHGPSLKRPGGGVTKTPPVRRPSSAQPVGMQKYHEARPATSQGSRGGSFGSFRTSVRRDVSPTTLIHDAINKTDEVADQKGCVVLSFEDRSLSELPHEIGDLKDLVYFGEQRQSAPYTIQLFLSKNRLATLPLCLFAVSQLTVLSLRDNDLQFLSPMVGELRQLEELYLSGNQLQYLPAELLDLSLRTLTVFPNPLLELPEGVGEATQARHCITRTYDAPTIPSLIELIQRSLAENSFTKLTLKRDRLSERTAALVEAALHAYESGRRCTHCHGTYIQPAASSTEWWNIFGQRRVPFKKFYCQYRCLLSDAMCSRSPSPQD